MSMVNLPEPRVDFLDERTGKIARDWVRYFQQLLNRVGGVESITLTQVIELISEGTIESSFASDQASQSAEMRKKIDDLAVAVATAPDSTALLAETIKSISSIGQILALKNNLALP